MRKRYLYLAIGLLVGVGGSAVGDDVAGDPRDLQARVEQSAVEQTGVEQSSAERAPRVAPDGDGTAAGEGSSRIDELIADLGSPRYSVRRMAANELRQIGAEAFDRLNAAMDSADPEVAASAEYLSRQITVRWVESGDSPAVRGILRNYGGESDRERERDIEALSRLPGGESLAALCRIARFDRSPLLARKAAMNIISPEQGSRNRSPVDPSVIDEELGGSTRTAARWLRQYREQLRDPAASVAGWRDLVDEEVAVFNRNSDDTDAGVVLELLWNQGEVYRQLGDHPALLGAIERMLKLDEGMVEQTTAALLQWLIEHRAWEVVDEFLTRHEAIVSQSKRPLYFAAIARVEQGKQEAAEEFAKKAAQIEPDGLLESCLIAQELEHKNQYEWAVREYQRVIDAQADQVATGHESILARAALANLHFDREKYSEAVATLEPLVSKIQEQGNAGILYNEVRQVYARRFGIALPESKALAAKLHHYRASEFHEKGDWAQERAELERAIALDKTDADVLIQMYRLPEQEDAWKEMVKRRIERLAAEMQEQIDESPNDPTNYNQWAWLISNTEGDYQKAVRYSQKSLELLGPAPSDSAQASFLDTLGRCYYAAGDLENAVKSQRQAIEKLDYMQVMHRQLAQFEAELAAKQGSE